MRAGRRQLAVTAAVVAAVVFLALTPAWSKIQGSLQFILNPLTRGWASVGNYVQMLARANRTEQAAADLSQELAVCTARQADTGLQNQVAGELSLLNLLPVPLSYQAKHVRLIGRRNDETGTRFIIDRGSADGIASGQPLVAGAITKGKSSGLLVGVVDQVTEHESTFAPITSPLARVAAEVVGVPGASGVASGEFNLAVRLQLLPAAAEVAAGSTVVTSHLNELMPPGLVIGTVSSVDQPTGDFFKSAVIAPAVSLESFHVLSVFIRS